MKFIAWAVALITLVVAGVYTMVSLARWEWTRALFFAIVFVAAELMVVAAALFARLGRMEQQLIEMERQPAASPPLPSRSTSLHVLRATRGDHDRFAWLRPDPEDVASRTNVFITLMVGGGVILSGGAWLLDKLASRTVDPRREASLGRQLDEITYQRGFVVDDVNVLARSRPQHDDPGLDAFLDPQP